MIKNTTITVFLLLTKGIYILVNFLTIYSGDGGGSSGNTLSYGGNCGLREVV